MERTAKDMPPGSTVDGRSRLVWTKVGVDCWRDSDGALFTDASIDVLLHSGGTITFIPAGQGDWLARAEQESQR